MTKARRTNRKREVLAAATELFSKEGYPAASIREIAEAVGMSKAGIYSSFASKGDMLEEIYYTIIDDMLAQMSQIVSSNLSPEDKLRRAISTQITGIAEHLPEMTIFYRERQHLSDLARQRVNERRDAYERMTKSIIQEGIERGDFLPVDVPVTAFGILGMCAWTYQWFHIGGRLSAEEVAALYADFVIRGLLRAQSGKCEG